MLGLTIAGNTFENAVNPSALDVYHSSATKSNSRRLYMSATLSNNTVVWTDAFIAANGGRLPALALRIGDSLSGDPAELAITAQGNQVVVSPNIQPGAIIQVASGTLNGQAMVNQSITWPTAAPAPPANLRLVNDNGVSSTDGVTSDPRLAFDANPKMAGYEYSLTGLAGSYLPVPSTSNFLAAGLAGGFSSVFVRAFDATGHRSSIVAIAFVNDNLSAPGGNGGVPSGSVTTLYEYRFGSAGTFIPLGHSMVVDASLFANGTPVLQIATAGPGGLPPSAGQPSQQVSPAVASEAGPPPAAAATFKLGPVPIATRAMAVAHPAKAQILDRVVARQQLALQRRHTTQVQVLGHQWTRPKNTFRAPTPAGAHTGAGQGAATSRGHLMALKHVLKAITPRRRG